MNAFATLTQRLYRSFGLMLALLLFLVGFSFFNFRRLSDANDWNTHSYRVLLSTQRLSESLFLVDSGARLFLFTGEPTAFHNYRQSLETYHERFADLQQQTQDRQVQQDNLQQLQQLETEWINENIEPALASRRLIHNNTEGLLLAGRTAASRRAKLMQLLSKISQIQSVEQSLLLKRSAEQKSLRSLTQITLVGGGIFSVFLTAGLIALVLKSSRALVDVNQQLNKEKARVEETNQQLLQINEQLQAQIAQRRSAEDKLTRSVLELKRSNSELEQFAHVASHDLQEPLRAVAGCVQVLQRRYSGKLDDRADQFIEHAVEGAQRMQQLIVDLLSYSRAGTKGKGFESVDGETILAAALQNIAVATRESEANITHDPLPMLICDARQIEQVLQNLLSNAIKFRGEKPPQIHLGCQRQSGEAGDFWVLSVTDQGPGIEPQYFERIFVMFQRLHSRAQYEGTGIGLAICKKIVERHGGNIWVKSEPGHGSTFAFSLPVTQPLDPSAPETEIPSLPKGDFRAS